MMHFVKREFEWVLGAGASSSSSSLLSLQVLEGPSALRCVIQESMSLKYVPDDDALCEARGCMGSRGGGVRGFWRWPAPEMLAGSGGHLC